MAALEHETAIKDRIPPMENALAKLRTGIDAARAAIAGEEAARIREAIRQRPPVDPVLREVVAELIVARLGERIHRLPDNDFANRNLMVDVMELLEPKLRALSWESMIARVVEVREPAQEHAGGDAMTEAEAKKRAREIAEQSGLRPEDAAVLALQAVRWAPLDAMALEREALEGLTAAQRAPWMPLLGARQLLVTLMREEAVVEMLPDDAARREYIAKNLHGYEEPAGTTLEEVQAEWERIKAAREAAAQPSGRAAQIAELRKHPAMMDPNHPEHDAVVQQLVKLHEE